MKKDGLTPGEEKVAQLIALGRGYTESRIAKKLGIAPVTVREMKRSHVFKIRVMQLFNDNLTFERAHRAGLIKGYLKPIYRALEKKLLPVNVDDLSVKDLVKLMAQFHYELRQDSLGKVPRFTEMEEKNRPREIDEEESDNESVDALADARMLYAEGRKSGSGLAH